MKNTKQICIKNIRQLLDKTHDSVPIPIVKIYNNPLINSYFSTTNQTISVNTGLIDFLTPAELKFDLAHEIGHYLIYQRLSSQQRKQIKDNFISDYHRMANFQIKRFKRDTKGIECLGLILPFLIIFLAGIAQINGLLNPLYFLIILMIMILIIISCPWLYRKVIKRIKNSDETVALDFLTTRQIKWFKDSEFQADAIGTRLTNPQIAIQTLKHLSKITKVQHSKWINKLLRMPPALHPSIQSRINRIKKES